MPIFHEQPLSRSFYTRSTLDVAAELPGKMLVSQSSDGLLLAARITEVEAYLGQDDPASHAFRGPRGRAEIMFSTPGTLYVYFSYGMHFCMNAVAHAGEGRAGAVLIRAALPVLGIDAMQRNRGVERPTARLARGPACLTAALGITREHNGADLVDGTVRIHAAGDPLESEEHVCASPRIGISKAVEFPWRFYLCGHPTLSGTGRLNQCKQPTKKLSKKPPHVIE